MKKIALLIILAATFVSQQSFAQKADTIKKNGFTLIVTCNDEKFDKNLTQQLINTFFVVYPKLMKEYNSKVTKEVIFAIDTAYDGVAATANGKVVFSVNYMTKHPKDIDVVTHEVMHIVQDYGQTNGPWWVTEGIADYARYKFGVANEAGNWTLPEYKPTQKYDNSYRITARFLAWIEAKVKKGTVKKLDAVMRAHTYNDNTWKDITGKSVEELWKQYSENPAI